MKKILSILLASLCCLMCLTALAACGEEPDTNDANEDIYYMEYKGTKIKLGDDAKSVLEKLGEANEVKELGDCGGFGAQVKYVYGNFNVYTLKKDDKETIDQISFTSDLVNTSKGICIGSAKNEVMEHYGQPTVQNSDELRYKKDNLVLKFSLEGDSVSAIDYISISQ